MATMALLPHNVTTQIQLSMASCRFFLWAYWPLQCWWLTHMLPNDANASQWISQQKYYIFIIRHRFSRVQYDREFKTWSWIRSIKWVNTILFYYSEIFLIPNKKKASVGSCISSFGIFIYFGRSQSFEVFSLLFSLQCEQSQSHTKVEKLMFSKLKQVKVFFCSHPLSFSCFYQKGKKEENHNKAAMSFLHVP